MTQARDIAKDVHENPPEPPPMEEGDGDEEDPGKEQDDKNQDKKTRAVPQAGSMNIVKGALYNTLMGLHEYEMRVMAQKRKSRPESFTEALNEWYPKFHEVLTEKLTPWKPVCDELGIDLGEVLNEAGLAHDFWHKETGDPLTLGTGMASIRALAHYIIQSLPDPTDSGVTI